jgi:15-cis-phytoene synthase
MTSARTGPGRGDVRPAAAELSPVMVRASLDHCRAVTRRRARNFYYAMKLTPQPKRGAMYAIYAFMRACDDLADEPLIGDTVAQSIDTRLGRIEHFRARMKQVLDTGVLPDEPVGRSIWPAFGYVMRRYPIDADLLNVMLDGQRCDLVKSRYQTFTELYDYCYAVASVVGLVCISVWGYHGDDDVRRMAEHRGIALQLTNILRDVVEDARRDRLYLPLEDVTRFGMDGEALIAALREGRALPGLEALLAFQVQRAGEYYHKSADLDGHIDDDCRPASWATMRIYRALYDRIAAAPISVLQGRVRVGLGRKVAIMLRALTHR